MELTSPWIDVGGMRGSLRSIRALLVQAKWTLHSEMMSFWLNSGSKESLFSYVFLSCVFLD